MTGISGKSPLDGDPKYENLRNIRDVIGYKGKIDQYGKPVDDNGKDIHKRTGKTGKS